MLKKFTFFLTIFLLRARAISRQPHVTPNNGVCVPSESTLPFPTLPRRLDQFGSCTPSTKSTTGLSPPTPIRERNWKLRLSPLPPTIAHWHVHATSILSYGGVFWAPIFWLRGTPPRPAVTPLGRNWLGWGFSTNAHTGTDPNISSSSSECHQQQTECPVACGPTTWSTAGGRDAPLPLPTRPTSAAPPPR